MKKNFYTPKFATISVNKMKVPVTTIPATKDPDFFVTLIHAPTF